MHKVLGMLIAAAIWLAGCATAGQRQAQTIGGNSESGDETLRACEHALYYSSQYDRQRILDCANVLDVWQ